MAEKSAGTVAEIFAAFLKLGLTSFGGPIAHLGYFRAEFVERRKWLSESSYADIVALCQFLPGPASSQVGFTLGILRGNGLLGGLAAWFAFTMPSALILFAFALGATAFTGPFAEGVLHGLKLVAVAVVAQAIWGMANSLTPDRARAAIALAAVAIVVFIGGSFGQIGAIALGAVAGLWLCRGDGPAPAGHLGFSVSRRHSAVALVLFAALFLITPLVTARTGSQGPCAVRRVLSFRRAGVRRRPCRAAAAAGGSGDAGLGQQCGFPRRLWHGASGARTAVHLCGLSRRHRTRSQRSGRRC